MLTNDLERVSIKGAEIRPRYVSVASKLQRERADTLLQVFRDHVGKTRGALNEAIADLVAERTDFKLQKGLAKLLLDRSEFQAQTPTDPGLNANRAPSIELLFSNSGSPISSNACLQKLM